MGRKSATAETTDRIAAAGMAAALGDEAPESGELPSTPSMGEGANDEGEEEEETPVAPKRALTKDEKRALFEQHEAAVAETAKLQERLVELQKKESETVKAIYESVGRGQRFLRHGKYVTPVKRGQLYFLRTSQVDAEEI